MKPADYLFAFRKITEEMCALTAAKNRDYAGGADAFSNFRLVEQIGVCSTEVGILTRLSDKLARVGRLLNKEAAVKTESVEDTLMDMAVYSIILLVYLRQKRNADRSATHAIYSDEEMLKRQWFNQPEMEVELDTAAEALSR